MANIVKINKVNLYIGFTETAADSYAAMKLLDDAGIKFNKLVYNDDAAHAGVFAALTSWSFGKEGSNYRKEFKQFPILHWTEYHDDWDQVLHVADGLEEIKACTLFANKALIEA
jgi:hypothetical protein